MLTPFRYVLSTTHLHEFKSADKAQAPVMSLYLPDQKLGSHSSEGGSSNKFVLKGRQTGTMHRGHTWVFRAESHDTMMAWYEDIKALTEKTAEERSQFVRTHSRSLSRSSRRSLSSDGMLDEDDDDEPFSATEMDVNPEPREDMVSRRPQAGGRFPSDLQVNAQRGLQAPQSPSSVSSGHQDFPNAEEYAVAGALPVAAYVAGQESRQLHHAPQENHMGYGGTVQTPMDDMPSQAAVACEQGHNDGINPYTSEPVSQPASQGGAYFAVGAMGVSGRQVQDVNGQLPAEAFAQDDQQAATTHGEVGGSYVNGAPPDKMKAIALAGINIPRSETQQEMALHSVPEASAAEHATPAGIPLGDMGGPSRRPTDHRADSVATLSNLPIPGRFPKGSGTLTPQAG